VDECKPLAAGELLCAVVPMVAAPGARVGGRGLHSFTLELNLSNSRTHSRFNFGCTVDRGAQVELKWERV